MRMCRQISVMHTIEGGDTSLAAEQSEEEGDIDEDVVPSLSHPALVSAGYPTLQAIRSDLQKQVLAADRKPTGLGKGEWSGGSRRGCLRWTWQAGERSGRVREVREGRRGVR